jgi:hypothetical protein
MRNSVGTRQHRRNSRVPAESRAARARGVDHGRVAAPRE